MKNSINKALYALLICSIPMISPQFIYSAESASIDAAEADATAETKNTEIQAQRQMKEQEVNMNSRNRRSTQEIKPDETDKKETEPKKERKKYRFDEINLKEMRDKQDQEEDQKEKAMQNKQDQEKVIQDEQKLKNMQRIEDPSKGPFSKESRWNKFKNELWKESWRKNFKNFKNYWKGEKEYIKTVVADAMAGDKESFDLFNSKETKKYIKDNYSSDEKRELVATLRIESEKINAENVIMLNKKLRDIDTTSEQKINAVHQKLNQQLTILEKATELAKNSMFMKPGEPEKKLQLQFQLTSEEATEYMTKVLNNGTFDENAYEQAKSDFENTSDQEIGTINENLTQELQSNSTEATHQQTIFNQTITDLSKSLGEICNNDQKIITTYDRNPQINIVNFIDFSTFTFDTTKTLEDNMTQLISDQKLTVPQHEQQGKAQFEEQLKNAMINQYVSKLGDMDQVSSVNVVPTILSKIPNFELFPEDLQTAILKSKKITLNDAQKQRLATLAETTGSINETTNKAAGLLEPQYFS